MIKIENVSKFYGKKKVLDSINLTFETGKVYGIVGENGAGKTTLFRSIAGIEKYSGKISSDFKSLKNCIGLLFTEPFFFSKITGREYLQLHANARNIKLAEIETKNIFDLPLHQYASTYSTGMKKKLALMAILLQKNEVYILDEPFNGVDIQGNIIISQIIQELKDLQKTVLVSSHIFSSLAEVCDEIFLMKRGKIEKRVTKEYFHELESEMKESSIVQRIRKLGLS